MNKMLLNKLEMAGALPDEDKKLLLKLAADVRPFPPRRDIIREGDNPDHVLLMIEGWCCRYKVLADGGRQITAFLIPGDFCDTHITMFNEMDHSIGSLTHCSIGFIPRDVMTELAARPAITRAMWWASLVDEAVLRAWIVNMGRRNALDRVAHLICEMHARLRNVGMADANVFELPLNQEELGDTLGITSVHVNRTLRKLREANVMTFRQQQIVITNMDMLRSIARFDPNYLHLKQYRRKAAP